MTMPRKKQIRRMRHLRHDEPIPDVQPRRYRTQHGYIEFRWKVGVDDYVREYEHRMVAGRPHPRFHVHHLNGIKDDNRPENLKVVTPAEHAELHADAALDQMIPLYESGLSTNQIAKIVGIDPSNVFRRLSAAGVEMRSAAEYRKAELDLDEVVALYRSGVGAKRVAKTFGTSVARVNAALRSRGVPVRRPGRPAKFVGVTSARDLVGKRSGGTCERCGSAPAAEWHHRKYRSQGGKWHVTNGLHLCSPCHRHVTENPAESYAHGWSVRSTVDPARVPVKRRGIYVWLSPSGDFEPLDFQELAEWIAA